ncbi:spore gernimation protein [Paenibacillus antri]|uniref:Spore gernimation protein n=1 Tax=Paenibacillus antri TaxID=2582848 RepID=A0A5R9GH63_9BACL|nr:GerAB/ArcD/ProY family transporter [Paenibacillus antri]TLS53786.1 spore gernimation protein [Paenibacillus antri]
MNEKLHPYHTAILIYMIQSGITIFSLPRTIAETYGTNGWVMVFAYAGLATIGIYLISVVHRKGGGESVFNIVESRLPTFATIPLYAALVLLWCLLAGLVCKQYIMILQMVAFPTTSPLAIHSMFGFLLYLLLVKSIYSISKTTTVFFYLSITMMFLLLFHIGDISLVRLTPYVLQGGTWDWRTILDIYAAFLGYELALFLIPYAGERRGFIKGVYAANAFVTFVYFSTTFVALGFFGVTMVKTMKYPILDLLAYVEFPFVERIENVLYSLFLFKILLTALMYLWAALETAKRIVPRANPKWLTVFLIGANLALAVPPTTLQEVEDWLRIGFETETLIALALPLLLIALLPLRKRRSTGGGSG